MSTTANTQSSGVPIAGPVHTESSAAGAALAIPSVMRVICVQQNSQGTGFLHKSGKIITAHHVINGCAAPVLLLSNGVQVSATLLAQDEDLDLALLEPASPIAVAPLKISTLQNLSIGAQVSTWGFPSGYSGLRPMLSVGVLSAQESVRTAPERKVVQQYVVNAAFNSGNSGGPLVHIETGEVIGVVVSKLAQISDLTMSALKALQETKSGFTYVQTRPDGTTQQLVEGQIIAMVLEDLRKQVQLVIGRAAMYGDLRAFLRRNNIADP